MGFKITVRLLIRCLLFERVIFIENVILEKEVVMVVKDVVVLIHLGRGAVARVFLR